MSDLISRSELYDQLANKLTWLMRYGDDVYLAVGSDIKDVIDNMPTAYDIDKVVEEIEKANQGCCNYCGCDLYSDDVIKIVKQGVVANDVCEYETKDDVIYASCNNKSIASVFCWFNECGDYKYCPYCGKKIKTVEVE